MTTRPPDPLTAEERALADRLARVAPRGGPSPQLDAAILAAARKPRVRLRARGRRWPAVVGLAASLALAVGIGWQLRPQPEIPLPAAPERESLPATAPKSPGSDTAPRRQAPPMTGASNGQDEQSGHAQPSDHGRRKSVPSPITAEPSPQARAIRAKAGPSRATQRAAADAPPAAVVPARARASVSVDAAARSDAATSAAPVPARTPEANAPGDHSLPSAPAPRSGAALRAGAPNAATAATAAVAEADATANARARTHRAPPPIVFDGPAPSPPAASGMSAAPVEQDAGLPLDAWFERIRQRRDGDDPASARASLDLLRRAYPAAVLPEDLRVWAAQAPPETPSPDAAGAIDPR